MTVWHFAQELIYVGSKEKEEGVMVNSDFENTYDMMIGSSWWRCLEQEDLVLNRVGSFRLMVLLDLLLSSMGKMLKRNRGIKQGDPLSPLIFVLVADQMLARAFKNGSIRYQA